MPVTVDIRHDLAGLQARLGLLPQERLQAAVRALNRTMTTVRAQAARDMGKEYAGLKIGAIKKRLRFKKATRSDAIATITFSGRRFRLINWNVRQTKTGIRGRLPWALETGDGKRITPAQLRHAFIRASRTHGIANVWQRAGKARMPIEVIVAPSLAAAFVERRIGEALVKVARERFRIVFEQEAKFRLSKRG